MVLFTDIGCGRRQRQFLRGACALGPSAAFCQCVQTTLRLGLRLQCNGDDRYKQRLLPEALNVFAVRVEAFEESA